MRIGIVGARLSGSYAALLLAQQGHEVLLFDDSTHKEKPCGGGVTAKAVGTMPWFRENPLPHTQIELLRLMTLDGRRSDVPLHHPIRIFSRLTLDSALRKCAVNSGARLLDARARGFVRTKGGWVVQTCGQEFEVDFLVGADGATSSVRSAVTGKFLATDVSLALGFYLPGQHHRDTIITVFQESGFMGYLWSFPRVDHVSVGILCWLPLANAADMRQRVLEFISEKYPNFTAQKKLYAARIPCLSHRSIARQRVCGENWALLGDAAGFVDAITAEGISFALRSAELLAESIRRGAPQFYESAWREDFGADLMRAAEWRDRFYGGTVLLHSFIGRALQALRHSATVRSLTDDQICGLRSYEQLRRQIILRSPRILLEALRHKLPW
ncbi:MAG TPA: NAD(P)/FAD-dependent oxidoreductase [Acidobacteriota bacterium]|nr:NAD(P)/FAD-dependent oxidoreductase [Acidobacteriota bacterium]